jgi:hypothetical protein
VGLSFSLGDTWKEQWWSSTGNGFLELVIKILEAKKFLPRTKG